MLQIGHLTITHKKDLRTIVRDLSLILNPGDKAVLIGEEGNGKSTLLKWIADPRLIEDYAEAEGTRT
ncbi:MAG: ATP-binding cassette domain-containing protein, partial [Lachnospiraceae bacterium]|nr:ATP-binding cassette domain-containing protein [Lachnospiraceae bacterium]